MEKFNGNDSSKLVIFTNHTDEDDNNEIIHQSVIFNESVLFMLCLG